MGVGRRDWVPRCRESYGGRTVRPFPKESHLAIRTITAWSCGPGDHSTRASGRYSRWKWREMRISATSLPRHARRCWRRPTGRAGAGRRPLAGDAYWYRFTDDSGAGSRVGRTITAPSASDPRPVRFAFVSCNSVNEGAQNAYRRMIWEDERAPADRKLGFVLHLGDFIYEVVEYPDEVSHRYSRTVYDLGRIPDDRKVGNFHVPTNLAGYRHVYRAHIDDPDIQDARAHFPFVCIGDNHEFSWQGWQSFIKYDGKIEPAQPLRVAANQAWWEYVPSRVRKASGPGLDQFDPPAVTSAPIDTFDDYGFGTEANNRVAVGSMTAYRAMRYGKNVDLILTDFHSYTMRNPGDRPETDVFDSLPGGSAGVV